MFILYVIICDILCDHILIHCIVCYDHGMITFTVYLLYTFYLHCIVFGVAVCNVSVTAVF